MHDDTIDGRQDMNVIEEELKKVRGSEPEVSENWSDRQMIDEEHREFDIMYRLMKKMKQNLCFMEDLLSEGMQRQYQRRKWKLYEESFCDFYADALKEYEDEELSLSGIKNVVYNKEEIGSILTKLQDFRKEIEAMERHMEYFGNIKLLQPDEKEDL